ncbi:MAG: prepilin-type N-terminal cleavage/methylation domain-containing protein [Bacillota bacterium]
MLQRTANVKDPALEKGFTLVEVLVVLAIVPLVLAVAFSAVSVALRTYRMINARSSLSSEGARVVEVISADVRGARAIYTDSSASRLHCLLQDGTSKVDYVFTRPHGSLRGTLTKNGEDLFSSSIAVDSCEFTYLVPEADPDLPPRAVAPDKASSVKVRLGLSCRGTSMTYESVFDLRNL